MNPRHRVEVNTLMKAFKKEKKKKINFLLTVKEIQHHTLL